MNFLIAATVLLAFSIATISANGDCGNIGKNQQNEMSKDEMKQMFDKVSECGCDRLCEGDAASDCKKCAKETAENKGKISDDCQKKLPKEVAPCIQMFNSADIKEDQIDKAVSFMNTMLALMPADITQAKQCPCEAMEASMKFMDDTAKDCKDDFEKAMDLGKKFFKTVLKHIIKDVKCAMDNVLENKDTHIGNCKKFAKEDLGMDDDSIQRSCDCGQGMMKLMMAKKKE